MTWLKLCSQLLRLTGDPGTVDEIERYAYNGLLGAMKPAGDGFSYVNLLDGVKTNPAGWGAKVTSPRRHLLQFEWSDGARIPAVRRRDEFKERSGYQPLQPRMGITAATPTGPGSKV